MKHLTVGVWVMLAFMGPLTHAAWGLEPTQVLVVANGALSASTDLAQYYARARGVPADHVLVLDLPASESIDRQTFEQAIESPIAAWLRRRGAMDQVLAIVLCKGVPHRVSGTSGRGGTQASVDSELTLLYRRMVGIPVAPQGPVANPYFLGTRPIAQAQPFSRTHVDTFLVTRLDGFTFDEAKGLVDRALQAGSSGAFVLDRREGQDVGDRWLLEAAQRLGQTAGVASLADVLPSVEADRRVSAVYSWGSSDPALRGRRSTYAFEPGAIVGRFMSTDARTFVEPPDGWEPTSWDSKDRYYEGSPEALVADLVRDGATAVSGNVAEPYLDSAVRPDVLLPAYASGFSVGEAFYLAMPSLSWQTVVVGDPLTRPFRSSVVTPSASASPTTVDPSTGFPVLFSDRRSDFLRSTHVVSRESAKLFLRAERLVLTDDLVGATAALEQATGQEPDFVAAQAALGNLYELQGRHEAAQERFRAVLRLRPRDPVALNNLAYSLAERSNRAAEALPLAQQAYSTAKGNPLVADTLGWVHFKLGEYAKASTFLQEAVSGVPGRADIRVRLALALAAQERLDDAEREFAEAKRQNGDVERSEHGRRLNELLRRSAPVGRP